MKTHKEIKIGIIGLGYRSSLAIRAHQPSNNTFVTAVTDPSSEAVANFCNQLPTVVENHTTVASMLQSPNVNTVFVLSPDYLHEEHVIQSLKAGKDVFLEKPMALNTASSERIINVVKRTKCKLFVGHNMRFMKFVTKMNDLILAGTIGDVKAIWVRHFIGNGESNYFNSWHCEREFSNSLLVHKGIHDIDIIQLFANSNARKVSAFGSKLVHTQGDVEDLSSVNMEMDNGILASYQQCHFSPDTWRNYTVIGTRGRLENFGDRSEAGATIKVWTSSTDYSAKADLECFVEAENRDCDLLCLNAFFDFLHESKHILPLQAAAALATVSAATASMRLGGQVVNV